MGHYNPTRQISNMFNVSIVLYRNPESEIRQLISEIKQYSSGLLKNIFLVDNSELEEGYSSLAQTEGIIYIRLEKNLGYGGGHNTAIRLSLNDNDVKYHCIINPDIKIISNVFEELHQHMEANPETGLIMPRILDRDGHFQYMYKMLPKPMDLISRRFFKNFFPDYVAKKNYIYELRFANTDNILDVPVISGCFMFSRLQSMYKFGMFDDCFFMYLEDIDLCRRIGEFEKIVYYPYVSVKHGHQRSSYKSLKYLYFHIKSAIHYFNKWGWFFDSHRKARNSAFMEKYMQ